MSARNSKLSFLALLLIVASIVAFAQTATGIIEGTVKDKSGAVVPNATVTITNKATGVSRTTQTNAEGLYSAPALVAGDYEVKVEITGFKTLVRPVQLLVGSDARVDMTMELGGATEVVTVEAASSEINFDNHQIQGVIEQQEIRDLPLNGRQYMQLAALEPGVVVTPGSTAQFNSLFNVSVLGAGNRTVFTIDGGNVSDNIDTAGGSSSMNFSQETVQEFQLSEVNFDLSTPIAAGGAINVVTRSGTNELHGSGYFYFRDHNMAAYPALKRACDPTALNPACNLFGPSSPQVNALNNPFFARRNPGFWVGAPIKKDKVFFFFNYEYLNQVQALSVVGNQPSLAQLAGVYSSPYAGKTITLRLDDHISDKHNLFFRYSHDGNSGFGDVFSNGDPSNWVVNRNWSDQSIIGLTSAITPFLVNDIRFQYNYWNNHNDQAAPSACVFPCIGSTLPELLSIVGSNFGFGNAAIGPNVNAPQARNTRRYETVESISWQKGAHRLKFGVDLNLTNSAGLWGFCTPACVGAYSPEFVRSLGLGSFFPTLPTVIKSDADILNLPFLALSPGIFTGIGVGSVSTPAPYDYSQNRAYNQYRAYAQDTWKVTSHFTLNFGVAWNAQTGFYNSDLAKPQFLAPFYGTTNLPATQNNMKEFQPAFGFAWSPFKDNKTVIRGGAGLYWDSTPGYYKLREPAVIGPLGDGRLTLSPSAFTNTIPGIIDFSTGGTPIKVGDPLPIQHLTTMTLGQFMTILNTQLPAIQAQFTANTPRSGPYGTTNVEVAKTGVEIYPPGFSPIARSYQTSLGVQRELGRDFVITADWARRQGENVALGELDITNFNRYVGGVQTPIVPVCTASQRFTVGVECINGPITQWTYQGRAVYEGLLVKATKRFSHRYQFIASYALQNQNTMTAWNLANWGAGYGPGLARQNLTVAGTVNLPWGLTLSVNSSIISRSPVEPSVPSIELPGTITTSQALPGLSYSCLNAGCGKSDLAAAVNAFNSTFAGTKDAKGGTVQTLALPSDYQLGDPTFSQDFRLTKVFTIKERYKFSILGEMFNAFNIANLTGYSFSLDSKSANPATQTFGFGQPTQRAFQTFGSGGPRALQVGGRFSF